MQFKLLLLLSGSRLKRTHSALNSYAQNGVRPFLFKYPLSTTLFIPPCTQKGWETSRAIPSRKICLRFFFLSSYNSPCSFPLSQMRACEDSQKTREEKKQQRNKNKQKKVSYSMLRSNTHPHTGICTHALTHSI